MFVCVYVQKLLFYSLSLFLRDNYNLECILFVLLLLLSFWLSFL